MGILCIFIGLIFFSNPSFRMLDYLPDVIGCILILIGTSKLSYVEYRIEQARKYAGYLTVLSAIKIPLSMYVAVREKGYLLPATFIYSILEGILLTGILMSLIGGLQYLTSREDCDAKHFKDSENASVICFIFSIARAVASFLPEIFSLGTQKDSFDYTFAPTPEQNAALLKPYAELLAFVLIFIFGIYFIFITGKYFIGLYADKTFRSALSKRYDTYVSEHIELVNFKRVRCALILLFISLLLLFNQLLDFVNVIPNTLSYIFMLITSLYMIRQLGCRNLKTFLPVYIPLIALSIYNNLTQYMLLSGTKIDFLNDTMFVKEVPELLQSPDNLPGLILPVIGEYIVLAALVTAFIKTLENLPFLRDNDTVSIFLLLFGGSAIVYLTSCAYTYFGQFIRTAYTFVTRSLDVYVKYDSVLVLFEWIMLISFFVMLYLAYKYGTDLLERVKPEKEDQQH